MKVRHITICALLGGMALGFTTIKTVEAPPLMEYGTQYRGSAKLEITIPYDFGGVPVINTLYDLDGDGQFEVSELRLITGVDEEGNYVSVLEPIIYGFDMNHDGMYDASETLLDEEMDGLNGNEKKLSELEQRINGVKI